MLPFFLLRTPVWPNPFPTKGPLIPSFEFLRENVFFQAAIASASPTLWQQMQKEGPLPPSVKQSILKYFIRMSTRPTPYGLLAGVSLGKIDATSKVSWKTKRLKPHHRLDIEYLLALIQALACMPKVQTQLRFYTNPIYYCHQDSLRYLDQVDGSHVISEVELTEPLRELLMDAQQGLTLQALEAKLTSHEYSKQAALCYIESLITNQLLINELHPSLTGENPLQLLLQKLSPLQDVSSELAFLKMLEKHLLLDEVSTRVPNLNVHNTPLSEIPVIQQTDLYLQTHSCTLSEKVRELITSQLSDLLVLPATQTDSSILSFAKHFRARYGAQSVPLLQALDPDWGIGFGDQVAPYAPLVEGLVPFASSPDTNSDSEAFRNLRTKVLKQALREKQTSIKIEAEDLASCQPSRTKIPTSFYALGNLIASSSASLDQGFFLFHLLSVYGPSAANLMARFATYDSALSDHLVDALREEEAQEPEAIFAEIVYLPKGRAGNIIQRPQLRTYEIPCLGKASVKPEFQIHLDDLSVQVEESGYIHLFSSRLQKKVIPRLSSAHNPAQGPPVYQFLVALQSQEHGFPLAWDWKELKEEPFLPRVIYQNICLCRARWRIKNYIPFRSLPRWVCLTHYDQELVLDLKKDWGRELLQAELSKHNTLILQEWLMPANHCWIREQNTSYTNEVILPFKSLKPPVLKPMPTLTFHQPYTFPPGSSWLYAKLYAGPTIQEELLTTQLPSILTQLADRLKSWFFIRYADPELHLRLRMQGNDSYFYVRALALLEKALSPLLTANQLYWQLDTYQREVDRYGPEAMLTSEDLFCVDSSATLAYLQTEWQPQDRILFALQSVDGYLEDAGFNLVAKQAFTHQQEEAFLLEHQADKTFRQQLNQRYQAYQPRIHTALAYPSEDCQRILQSRSAKVLPLFTQLAQVSALPARLPDYLHMSINRLFTAHQRTYELLTYYFLTRYYTSQLARLNQMIHLPR
ncbi:lantibiotic dehydratase [Siphonobacter curvatus]|nr:lantibiotic dehydratase [Siphonobacter curvatus]